MQLLARLFACFAAGAMGALVNSAAVWAFGKYGINQFFDFAMAPPLTWDWLGPRLLYGGLWGFLFVLPFWGRRPWRKGVLLSIAPTAYMLLQVFPEMGAGLWGLGKGEGAPYLVAFFNILWGLAASGFLVASRVGSVGSQVK